MDQQKAFTLLELMITVVIIGILAAIAFPSYQQYIQAGRRTDAQTALLKIAAMQEQYFMDNKTYTNDLTNLGLTNPFVTEGGYYNVNSACTDCAIDFTLTAAPKGAQAGDGDLTFNHLGSKTYKGNTGWK